MDQPELSAVAAEGRGTDRFAAARERMPEARMILFHDRRTGTEFMVAVPPSSAWHTLLPPEQDVEIRAKEASA